ncbi:MAG: pyridoxal phosphate-dependent aminotransferase [Deltaproteobacteria bacterium]|nr:pyridoxal phosphate-dependent aminotransferase [Deltaproteobacteria bacterium]
MPGYPNVARAIAAMPSSVYSSVTARLKAYQGEIYPLHIGDTWMEPAVGCRMEDLTVEDHPGLHRYTPPTGLPELRAAIAHRTEAETSLATGSSEVLISAGATAALSTVVGALVDPGDEVLIMAPYWPLIGGMVRAFRGEPVEVPFFAGSQLPNSPESAVEAFRRHTTKRTVAIYLNTPHNPSGRVLPSAWSQAILQWATEAGLWVLSDEVYAPFVYAGEHSSLRPMAAERTVTIGSFSKAYGMTGNRCGYLVGPAGLLTQCNKIGTNTYYCAPRASQIAALAALNSPRANTWVTEARDKYHRLGRMAAARVGLPAPEGSTFLFLDVADRLDERGLLGFLEDCADRGLLVAPGPSFGPYPTHIRVCFTCAEPALIEKGFEVLAELLG